MPKIPFMPGRVFSHQHRVTYSECTAGNHVYYARYLDLLEAARAEIFRHVGQPFVRWQENDTIFPVIECHLRYKGAAHYDDLLTLEIWITELGRVRLTFGARILDEAGRVILEASTTHACTTIGAQPKRIPEELVNALRAYVHSAPGRNARRTAGAINAGGKASSERRGHDRHFGEN